MERGAQLLGAAQAQRMALGTVRLLAFGPLRQPTMERVCAALGDDVFEAAYARGQALSLDGAVALALEETPPAESD